MTSKAEKIADTNKRQLIVIALSQILNTLHENSGCISWDQRLNSLLPTKLDWKKVPRILRPGMGDKRFQK